MAIKKSMSQKVFNVCNIAFLGLFGFVAFYPFWYILIASFNAGNDFMKGGVYVIPRVFTIDNYKRAFNSDQIVDALMISLGRTGLGILLGLIFTTLFAYALHTRSLPGRSFFVMYFYFTTIFSGGMIPYYILLRDLGLTKSFFIYVIPSIFSFFNMILVRTFFDGIPGELRESAVIDGAGEWRTFFRIYVPLSTPVMATIALFIGVSHWNDWFTGAYYVQNIKLFPAATLLQKILLEATASQTIKIGQESSTTIKSSTVTPQSMQMAFVMLLTMPIVVLYPFVQKYFVKGAMVGAIKG